MERQAKRMRLGDRPGITTIPASREIFAGVRTHVLPELLLITAGYIKATTA